MSLHRTLVFKNRALILNPVEGVCFYLIVFKVGTNKCDKTCALGKGHPVKR